MAAQEQPTRDADAELDLRSLLTLDHARLDQLFNALVEAFESDAGLEAARLWTEFDSELRKHFALEEQSIFPIFAKVAPAEAAILAREHDELRSKLGKLGLGVDLHLTRAAAVSEYVSALRSHAKREDALLYRWAQTHLSEHVQSELRTRLLSAIQKFLGTNRPT